LGGGQSDHPAPDRRRPLLLRVPPGLRPGLSRPYARPVRRGRRAGPGHGHRPARDGGRGAGRDADQGHHGGRLGGHLGQAAQRRHRGRHRPRGVLRAVDRPGGGFRGGAVPARPRRGSPEDGGLMSGRHHHGEYSAVNDYADDAAYLAGLRERLALPGIVDVHTHFMPESVMNKVWAYFDSAGPLVGRPWPITYRDEEQVRLKTLRAFGVRAFTALVYPHKPDMAAWLNGWTAEF